MLKVTDTEGNIHYLNPAYIVEVTAGLSDGGACILLHTGTNSLRLYFKESMDEIFRLFHLLK